MNYNIYEPIPRDSHKSFYGKCKVVELTDDMKLVYSYNTQVALIVEGKRIYRLWKGYSATTLRHIDSIYEPKITKRQWDSLPISDVYDALMHERLTESDTLKVASFCTETHDYIS